MKVVFRVDTSAVIGAGHFMRCVTLASALKENGVQVHFICRSLPEHFRSLLRKQELEFRLFNQIFRNGESDDHSSSQSPVAFQEEDSRETINAIGDVDFDWLIVDHYGLDRIWESLLKNRVKHLMVLDDLADREHRCEILLDPTYGETSIRYEHLVPADCRILCGSEFALLRPQFSLSRQSIERVLPPGEEARVHLFFGSSDTANHTARFSRMLLVNFPSITLSAVVGRDYEPVEQLEELSVEYGARFRWDADLADMAGSIKECDVAIGAPGGTTWERACIGLPSAYLAVARNQIPILERLESSGLCVYLGEAGGLEEGPFLSKMHAFLSDVPALRSMRSVGMRAVDGLGTDRVVSAIRELC